MCCLGPLEVIKHHGEFLKECLPVMENRTAMLHQWGGLIQGIPHPEIYDDACLYLTPGGFRLGYAERMVLDKGCLL